MATRYYGADIGATMPQGVVEAGSTTSKNIELTVVYDASGMTKQTVLNALEAFKAYLLQDTYPPV